MNELTFRDSVRVASPPDRLYDLISDVTRMAHWSPVVTATVWDDPAEAGRVGSVFTGHNELPGRVWTTRCQVVVAEPGREFAWEVNDHLVRWSYAMTSAADGTELAGTWTFLPAGIEHFRRTYGDDADHEIGERARLAREGIPATLRAIKTTAER